MVHQGFRRSTDSGRRRDCAEHPGGDAVLKCEVPVGVGRRHQITNTPRHVHCRRSSRRLSRAGFAFFCHEDASILRADVMRALRLTTKGCRSEHGVSPTCREMRIVILEVRHAQTCGARDIGADLRVYGCVRAGTRDRITRVRRIVRDSGEGPSVPAINTSVVGWITRGWGVGIG